MASPRTQVALALVGLLALAVVAAQVLPMEPGDFEAHQLPPLPGAPVVAAPIEMEGATAPGQALRVRVFSPADPAVTLVRLDTGPPFAAVHVLGTTVLEGPGASAPITVAGDALRDQVVTLTLTVQGQPHWVRVDRSTSPATITLSPSLLALVPTLPPEARGALPPQVALTVPGTIQAPVAFRGSPASPTEVTVFDPAAGATGQGPLPGGLVFQYRDNGDGTSSVAYRNGTTGSVETRTVPNDQVLVEGSPLGDAFRVRLRPEGAAPVTFTAPLGALRGVLATGGANPDSYLSIARDATFDTRAYKAATDGTRTLDPANLTGTAFLSGAVPQRILVDVRAERDLGPPVILMDTAVPADGPGQQRATAQRAAEKSGFVRYEATVPASWLDGLADGATVHFTIAYRTSVANLVTQRFVDDNAGAAYRYRVDRTAPGQPTVTTSVPDPAQPTLLIVQWNATDAASGVAGFRVEKGRVNGGETTWEPWIEAAREGEAEFTGAPGATHRFRARATDAVGLTGPWGQSQPRTIPAADTGPGAGAVNRAPTVQLRQPTGGEAFDSVPSVLIEWRASDPDGTVPVINLFTSSDGGATWEPLASPRGTRYTWDVATLPAGDAYRVKVEATDGSLATQDTSGRFTIDNTGLATAESIGGPDAQAALPGPGAPPGGPAPEVPPDGETEPQAPAARPLDPMVMVVLAVVLIGAAVGVAVWQWKARGR